MKRTLQPFSDFEDRITADPERRQEYEAGWRALRFGYQVSARREELGYTQTDLAQFGIPRRTLIRIEKGDCLPDPKTQLALAAALNARVVVEPTGEWNLENVAALREAA